MLRISHLDHIVLRVTDLDAMTRFYCDVLGCTVERRQEEIGLLQLRAGACLVDMVPVDGKLGRMGGAAAAVEGHNLDHFCFRVEPFDAEAIRAHLAAHGVAAGPVETRYGAEGEGPSLYLQDPEGNTVELKGPPFELFQGADKRRKHVIFGIICCAAPAVEIRCKAGQMRYISSFFIALQQFFAKMANVLLTT